jgi:hypothetical protein
MEGAELLPTLAEIAVAFAGFASLVSILGGRSSGDQLVANLVRLRGMLQSAILVLAFSFAPFLPVGRLPLRPLRRPRDVQRSLHAGRDLGMQCRDARGLTSRCSARGARFTLLAQS